MEPRWIDLAAELRQDAVIGYSARRLLDGLPLAVAVAAIDRSPRRSVVAVVGLAVGGGRRDWVSRYRSGDHGVWAEVQEHADAIAADPGLRAEAYAVARELMTRVRANRDQLRETLVRSGARLGPERHVASDSTIATFTQRFGPLPIAVEAFYRVVGSISLQPEGNDYTYGDSALEREGVALLALDPLQVAPLDDNQYQLAEYIEACAASHPEIVDPFELAVAPDYLHKQNVSGGAPYSYRLPPPTALDGVDPIVKLAHAPARFVDYLRHAFRWGGFPILEVADRPVAWIDPNERVAFERVLGPWGPPAAQLLARLRRGLTEL